MIHIFGLGANGLASLSAEARQTLHACQTLFGGPRHLALVPDGPVKCPWPRPWRLPLAEIEAAQGPVGVLVSGDPSWYSAARGLIENVDCQVWPVPGAFSLAAARLGWALEEVTCASLHGRGQNAAEAMVSTVSGTGGRYLLLSDRTSLRHFLDALDPLAFAPLTHLRLLCDLGAAQERIVTLDLDDPSVPHTNLFTIAIDLAPAPRLLLDADFLPDDAFASHGKITKFEARQSAVAHLARADVLWDVGAGAGTVGLQAAYTLQPRQVFLIEHEAQALAVLDQNCANSSAPAAIIAGTAPAALHDLPTPDAIFIGGGLGDPAALQFCYQALAPQGRLVAHAVTLESEQVLLGFFQDHPDAQLSRLQLSQADAVGRLHGWRPAMPLTQLVIEKP